MNGLFFIRPLPAHSTYVRLLGISVLLMLLSACSTTLTVTYDSNPPGAILFDANGNPVGRAPITRGYELWESEVATGILTGWPNGTPASAQWASGATKTWDMRMNLGGPLQQGQHYNWRMTFQRPNAPGLDIDMAYALKVEELTLQRRGVEAQENAAAAAWANQQATQRALQKTTTCNTVNVGTPSFPNYQTVCN